MRFDRPTALRSRVDHFGPSEDFVGGMASVLTVLRENSLGADDVRTHATWVPTGFLSVLRVWLGALVAVLRLPPGTVVHCHVSEGGSLVRKGAILWVARYRGLPRVVTVHGYSFEEFARRHPALVRTALRAADVVTVLTTDARDVLTAIDLHGCVEVVDNPVTPEATVTDAGASPPVVLFAGEVGTRKGVDVLLEAWGIVIERVPGAQLRIAGPLADVDPVGTPACTYLGVLAGRSVRDEILGARVVVLPSRAEARPMVLLEAAASGRPFVATPVGSIPDIADEGGHLVDIGDAWALANALQDLLEDEASATEMGHRAFAGAQRRGPENVSRQLCRIYETARRGRAGQVGGRRLRP